MAKTADDIVAAIKQLGKEIKESLPDPVADREQQTRLTREEEISQIEKTNQQLAIKLKMEDDEIAKSNILLEMSKNRLELAKKSNLTKEELDKIIKKETRSQTRHTAAKKKNTKATQENTKAQDENAAAVESVVENLTGFLGVSRSYEKSIFKQIIAIGKNTEAQKKLNEELSKSLTAGKLAWSGLSKVIQVGTGLAIKGFAEFESGLTSFNQATGMAEKFGMQIAKDSMTMRRYGVTTEDAGRALAQLGQVYPLKALGEGSTEVASQFALYEKFGVSVQSSATIFTSLTRSLGRTKEEALRTQNNIAALGIELGMGAGKLTEDFAQALPRLAIYGKQAEKVFRNVAKASAGLGISTDDIIGLAEGFQTFEGSAQAAGKLNAILGGGFIDNLELMQKSFEDPAQAAMMIKDAFKSAGQSVSSMGPAAIKAAATAAGFTDVGKFTSFLNGELSAAELTKDDQKSLSIDANKIAARSQGFLAKIFDSLQEFVNAFSFEKFDKTLKAVGGVVENMTPGDMAATGTVAAIGTGLLAGKATIAGGKFLGSKVLSKLSGKTAATDLGKEGMEKKLKKQAAKKGTGFLAKTAGKKLPFGLGALFSLGLIGSSLMAGDFVGAGLETASAAAATVPGAGTAASFAIDAANMARTPTDSSMPSKKPQASLNDSTQDVTEVRHIVEIIQNTPKAEQFVTAVYRKSVSSNVRG